jgi:hypothetical protein
MYNKYSRLTEIHRQQLVYCKFIIMLHFYLFYCNLSTKIGHDHVCAMLFRQRLIFCHGYVMHLAISWFHVLELPNDIQIADK